MKDNKQKEDKLVEELYDENKVSQKANENVQFEYNASFNKKKNAKPKKERGLGYEIFTWIRDFAIIIVAFALFTTFVAERTVVEGSSMEPSIQDNDRIYISKLSYRIGEPERFDVVVFPYDRDTNKNYIKRIIGLPGETVNLDRETGNIIIDGVVLEEHYGKETIRDFGNQTYPLTVPEGEYYVLGDNRNFSHDSRRIDVGTIAKEDILGKAGLRVWPFNHIGFIE